MLPYQEDAFIKLKLQQQACDLIQRARFILISAKDQANAELADQLVNFLNTEITLGITRNLPIVEWRKQ